MSQKTNLNIGPYYDDFNSENNFYKVLFKPGYPVQSRELTTLQSIIQNQVEDFGSFVFKEGSMVIPGNIGYDPNFFAVKLNPTQFGVDISLYIENFLGKTIVGEVTGITAKVRKVVLPVESDDVEYITLYLKYLDSDQNFEFTEFQDGETLSSLDNVTYGNTTINSGTAFASLISSESTSVGSAAFIGQGVYFVRGYFVNVNDENIILDYYTNTPSYRVGLTVTESIVSAKEDSSLFDNAKGFSNFASPGADRLKISLTLSKKDLTDNNDTNFIELLQVEDGKIKKIETKSEFSKIRDYLAERTYDESGHYTINPFDITLSNSLNDRLGNDGVFFENEQTYQGNIPSNDLASLKISPGKAYVRGYDIEKVSTEIVDIEKPRDTQNLSDVGISFEIGNLFTVNNVTGLAKIRTTIDLHSQFSGFGSKVGEARVYSFNLRDSAYLDNSTNWDLRLYDIQTYTKLTLNTDLTENEYLESFVVEGATSGASGFLVSDSSVSNIIFLRQTSGTFVKGEGLIVNGIESSRSVEFVQSYGIEDIKSVRQITPFSSSSSDFIADTVLDRVSFNGGISLISVSGSSNGISTVTANGRKFVGIKTDNIIRYQRSNLNLETYNRVVSISNDGLSFEVVGIATVAGVFDGSVPASPGFFVSGSEIVDSQVTGFIGQPTIRGSGKLYALLPEKNTSSLDLSSSNLYLNDQIVGKNVNIDNELQLTTSGDLSNINGITWSTFDEERYTVGYANGNIPRITDDSISISGSNLTIKGLDNTLSFNDTVVNVTVLKDNIQSKVKNYDRSTVTFVTRSKFKESGLNENTSKNDGLSFNNYYGLRVQDKEISLNYPDVAKVICVYESLDKFDPVLDKLQFSSSPDVSNNAIIGENIIGTQSGAVARVVANVTTTPSASTDTLGVVYLNNQRFSVGETVKFKESNINSTLDGIIKGSYKDISDSFKLDRGQKEQYYDYSRIVRSRSASEPSRRIMIVFDHYSVPSNETGDVFTVASYQEERYSNDIPLISGKVRATDTLDFRPRVTKFDPNVTTDKSPFDFVSRTGAFSSNPSRLLAAGESSILSQNFYLPRIDKVYLTTTGEFLVDKGISSKNPEEPKTREDMLELSTINLPAYLYDPQDAEIVSVDNKRYTMRDISLIEDRVDVLEEITSLSLLEANVQSSQIKDSEGRDRFKTGFFVDDFSNYSKIDSFLSTVLIDDEYKNLLPNISRDSLDSIVVSKDNTTINDLDLNENFVLKDSSIQKTGKSLTLSYIQKDWIEQPFATKSEKVNSFGISSYDGKITLNPSSDEWFRTIEGNINHKKPQKNIEVEKESDLVNTGNDNTSLDKVTESYLRSRNVEFTALNLKPNTRFYHFLDGNSDVDVIPKLIEIATDSSLFIDGSSGSFEVGETVIGFIDGVAKIRFRVCNQNHKSGRFDNPTEKYTVNPYNKTLSLTSTYGTTSKVLNVDTSSLADLRQGLYFGYITKGMKLVGQSSNATSYVKDIRLISDNYGDLIGTFFIKNPYSTPKPAIRIPTGNKTFKLTTSKSNTVNSILRSDTESSNSLGLPTISNIPQSKAETNYVSKQTHIKFERPLSKIKAKSRSIRNAIQEEVIPNVTVIKNSDPLAQTFSVGNNLGSQSEIETNVDVNGATLTSLDLYFASIDSGNEEITVEIRSTEYGIPTRNIIGKPAILKPRTLNEDGTETININVSSTGNVATNIKFPEPIFLNPGREYAIVISSDKSEEYSLWTAVMGQQTIETKNLPDVDTVRYTKKVGIGFLYKNQNGSNWTPNKYQDLKFKLYKAEFTKTSGIAYFYNPQLSEGNTFVPTLRNNPITVLPKTGRISISTTTSSILIDALSAGRKLVGTNSNGGSAIVVGSGSSVTNVEITNSGENYPKSVTETVDTYNILGKGRNLKLNITTNSSGTVISVGQSSTNAGNGYQVGDVVGIVTSSTSSTTGNGSRITISATNGLDTIYLTNVQGEFGIQGSGHEFAVGAGISYYSDSGSVVSTSANIIDSISDGGLNSGNYIKVNHFNHGMYSDTNKVLIKNIQSSEVSTILNSTLSFNNTGTISVANTSVFVNFEGIPVSGTNLGYVKVGDEIISYSAVGSGSLTISPNGRGIDSTKITTHTTGSTVEKYELSGVSLRRINNITHNVSTPIEMDSYYIEFSRGNQYGKDRNLDGSTNKYPQLSFNDSRVLGGSNVTASQNISFGAVVPNYEIITPSSSTSVSAQIRTVTGTSVGGNEAPFNDKGFENVLLNSLNPLNSVRLVCSEVNQNEYLTNLPNKKSFTTAIKFETSDPNLSPILNLDHAFTEFYSYRLNNPVSDYAKDSRVNSIVNDPHSSAYYSNLIKLRNPASTLKVILSAEKPVGTDFRVLYKLIKSDSSEVEQAFNLFPGYTNLTQSKDGLIVIDEANNSGLSDRKIDSSIEGEFLEYEFTAENLDLFIGFIIKIVYSSTNQAKTVRINDLRCIAIR
jgi:hypothetical protein